MSKRDIIKIHDKSYYAVRNAKGRFTDIANIGKSIEKDSRGHPKSIAKPGHGHEGDLKKEGNIASVELRSSQSPE